jgi:hypothetical protein
VEDSTQPLDLLLARVITIFSPHLTSHPITFIHQIIRPSSPSAAPLQHDCIYLHEPNPLVYDPPATVPPLDASLSSLPSLSNLSPCQLLHRHPSHRYLACLFQQPKLNTHCKRSWFDLLATKVSQTHQSPSQRHHNPSSHKFIPHS